MDFDSNKTRSEIKCYRPLKYLDVSKEVTDEDVDTNANATILVELVIKEGPAAEGDTVVIDL